MGQGPGEPRHDEAGFESLKEKIFEERSLDLSKYKSKFLQRRFMARMRPLGIETYANYMEVLDSEPSEYQRLFDKLTINVTEFFRNPTMWDTFRRKILPEVLSDLMEKRYVRFWSAGCSSGEEVYTIAMIVDQYLWNKDHNLDVVIRGTDLDNDTLKKARKGVYQADKVRKVPDLYRRLYLKRDGEEYQVIEDILKRVRLARHDLIGGRRYKYFDVIFCRNVIIYFTKEQQNDLFHSFHEALSQDGYLIIGKTETLMGDCKKLFKIVNSHERIYQKR